MMKPNLKILTGALLAAVSAGPCLQAQLISLSNLSENTYTQNFSGMTPSSLPSGWSIESFSEHTWNWRGAIDNGSDGISGIRYFGSPPSTTVALGFIANGNWDGTTPGTWDIAAIAAFENDTDIVIGKIDVSYSAQQWWEGAGDGTGRDSSITLAYRVDGGDWEIFHELLYSAPFATTAGAAVTPPASSDRSIEISTSVPVGGNFELAWLYDGTRTGGVGGRQGIGFTDIVVTVAEADEVTDPVDPTEWAGYEIEDGWVDTEDFLGLLYVVHSPWIFSAESQSWVFIPEEAVQSSGAWMFVLVP